MCGGVPNIKNSSFCKTKCLCFLDSQSPFPSHPCPGKPVTAILDDIILLLFCSRSQDPLDPVVWVNRVTLPQVKEGADKKNSVMAFRSQKFKSVEVKNESQA